MLPRINAIRYVTPLREGGSLPGIIEADDLGTYVTKFRGAGQGLKVLVAEVIVGELARRIGLHVPELAAINLDAAIAKYEADAEVQDLLTASVGLNLAIDFLPGAFGFEANCHIEPEVAIAILWLDSFVANVDRSWRNPNLLEWHGTVYCIDHGASLYFHHSWSRPSGWRDSVERFARQPYGVGDHLFGRFASRVPAADERWRPLLTEELLGDVVDAVPDEWLETMPGAPDVATIKAAYVDHLTARLSGSRPWLPGAGAA